MTVKNDAVSESSVSGLKNNTEPVSISPAKDIVEKTSPKIGMISKNKNLILLEISFILL